MLLKDSEINDVSEQVGEPFSIELKSTYGHIYLGLHSAEQMEKWIS